MAAASIQITPEDIRKGKLMKILEDIADCWTKVKLEDGTVLWIKLIVQSVLKLDKFNPDGTPIYFIQSTNIIRPFCPENVRGPILAKHEE